MDEDWTTIAEAAARSGLPESTLRYWERIGLVNRVQRDASSGHRRYRPEDVATRVTSPFGFESTAAEVIAGLDLHGRRALITGAASGIGVETARALASAGAETVIAARDLAAAERTAADIRATTGNPAVSIAPARPARPRLGRPAGPRPDRSAAHPGQQRRGDGRARAAPQPGRA